MVVFFFNFRCDYYNCNENLPVFKRGHMEYTVHELVSTLLGSFDEGKVCSAQPVSVEHNCSFLVDLKCVADPNDLRADDCGVWKHQGVRKNWVVVDSKGSILFQNRKCAPRQQAIPRKCCLYVLTRVYHVLQASDDFKRMIVTLQGGWAGYIIFLQH